ncbi:MAG TPA: rod shape-determining protein MreC [Bacteroidales bacterium]|nr:rod shape-determining protein MreC [Bacteroidales bacterium]
MRNFFNFLIRQYFFFLFLILEIISFVLIVQYNYYQKSSFINTTNNISGGILSSFHSISEYFSLRETNQKLAEENARLLSEAAKFYLKTDTLTHFQKDTIYNRQFVFTTAKVLSNSTNRRNNYLTLNKGSKHGISIDMGVISSNGIVGIVKEVSSHFSSVISVLNKETKISAKIRKNGQIGTVIWEGGNYRYGHLIDIPTHIKPLIGDTIITSGFSNSFPEGILIGTISDFKIEKGDNFYTITIKFLNDFNSISYVNVIKNLMKPELDELTKNNKND